MKRIAVPPVDRRTTSDPVIAGVLCLAIIVFYLPALFGGAYLYADDYYFRQLAARGDLGWWNNLFTQMGRPLLGLFINVAFRSLETVAAYAWVRAFALLGTLLFALVGYRFARREGWHPAFAGGLILLITTSPGWGVFVGWPGCAPYSWSALAAFVAGNWLLHPPFSRPHPVLTAALATGLALVAVSIYQITAGFILLPLLLHLRQERPVKQQLREQAAAVALTVFVFVANFLFIRAIKPFFGGGDLSRDGLVRDLGERFTTLGNHVIPELALSWTVYGSSWLTVACGSLLVATLGLAFAAALQSRTATHSLRQTLPWTLPALALGFAPLALIGDFYFWWRMLPSVLAIAAASILLVHSSPSVRGGLARTGTVAAVIYLGIQFVWGAHVFREGLVAPNARETQAWRTVLQEQFSERPEALIYFEPADMKDDFSSVPMIDEYGHGTASYTWIAQNSINTYLDELFPESAPGSTTITNIPDHLRPYAPDCPHYLEGRRIVTPGRPAERKTPLGTRQHGLLGELTIIEHYWEAGWMGAYSYHSYPWLLHATYGWIWLHEGRSVPDRLVFKDKAGHTFILHRDRAPDLYWEDGERWIGPCDLATLPSNPS